jgi:hypothetical protein
MPNNARPVSIEAMDFMQISSLPIVNVGLPRQ